MPQIAFPPIGIFLLSLLLSFILLPSIIRLSHRIDALDRPGGHKAQERPVPYLGGVGILLSLSLTLVLAVRFDRSEAWLPLAGIPLGGVFAFVLGILDDRKPVNAVAKLLLVFIASLIVMAFGVRATLFPAPWGLIPNLVLSMLWIAGATSALNSLDNTDGAAGGVTAVAAAGVLGIYATHGWTEDQPYLVALACALLGSCLGFLRFNWPRARIYLGNNGSFFLGFTLGCLLLFARWSETPIRSALIPLVLLTVPILDITLSTALRYWHGVVSTVRGAIVHCGHDHLAHRLKALGVSNAGAGAVLWAIGAVSAAEAVLLCSIESDAGFWAVAAGHGALVALVSLVLSRAPVYPPPGPRPPDREATPAGKEADSMVAAGGKRNGTRASAG